MNPAQDSDDIVQREQGLIEPALQAAEELTSALRGPKPPPDSFPGYEIIREIHRGAQGVVYLAVQETTDRNVAIKALREGPYATPSARSRFEREIKLAGNLQHPNIITIFDAGLTPDGCRYYVMDFVRGTSLREYVRQSELSLEETLRLLETICRAIHHAHECGIIHRDLKPSNILVDGAGVPKVLDFGLAKQLAGPAQTLVSATGQVVGTLAYMSPEQAGGHPDEVDIRTDVYALGVIMHEILAGRYPYPAGWQMAEMPERAAETLLTPPRKAWTEDGGVAPRPGRRAWLRCPIDKEVEAIILKALARERNRRYQSAQDLADDLKHYVARERTIARRESLWYGANMLWRRSLDARAVVVLAALILTVGLFRFGGTSAHRIDSLAVLPFASANENPDFGYLSACVAESIINRLAPLPDLRVISRTTAFRYSGQDVDPLAVGRELGVRAVLVGRIEQRGEAFYVSAELVDTRDSSQLWSASYDKPFADILSIQEQLAGEIAAALSLRLSAEQRTRLTKRHTKSAEANEYYLKGRYFWNKRSAHGLRKAIDYFERAITEDPDYGLAYAGLADAYVLLPSYSNVPPKETYPLARTAALKALEIDDLLAEAHTSLALVMFNYDRDWIGAVREFGRAIEINPNYASAHHWYALYFARLGQVDAALEQVNKAHRLDPLSLVVNTAVGWHLSFARRYDEAIEQYRKVIEMDPRHAGVRGDLAVAYLATARYDEAIAEFQKGVALCGGCPHLTAGLAYAYAVAGRKGAALGLLEKLEGMSQQAYVSPADFAWVYTGLGDTDLAFEWLERAYAARCSELNYLRVSARFDPLRSDPRFEHFVRRMDLLP